MLVFVFVVTSISYFSFKCPSHSCRPTNDTAGSGWNENCC